MGLSMMPVERCRRSSPVTCGNREDDEGDNGLIDFGRPYDRK
jgi:hypothetical protein